MRLLLVRHAVAKDRARWAAAGHDEHDRPLTAKGGARFRAVAPRLARLAAPGLVATSGLARADQTAALLAAAAGGVRVVTAGALAPGGSPAGIARFVKRHAACDTLALVGHEPDLSALAAWLLAGREEPLFALRKGGAALLDLPNGPAPAAGRLVWLLTPRVLSRTGGPRSR